METKEIEIKEKNSDNRWQERTICLVVRIKGS